MKIFPRPAVGVLLVLLAAEFLLAVAALLYLVVELLIATPTSFVSAIVLTVLTGIAVVWVGAILVGMWRGTAWSRGAGLVWQILQFAVGVGALQGALAQPIWGWPLTMASIAGVVLLLSRPIVEWTRREQSTSNGGRT